MTKAVTEPGAKSLWRVSAETEIYYEVTDLARHPNVPIPKNYNR